MEIGIGLGITRFPGWGVMNIGQLFASGEQGAWYDPSDMSTLFQDAAGTTPVTAVEQPVGRILDKSGRGNHATQSTTTKRPVLSRRVNLLTKTEDFSDAIWAKNSGTTVSDRKVISGTGNGYQGIHYSIAVAVGSEYITSCRVRAAGYTRFTISDGAFSRFAFTFDLTSGVITESLGVNYASATITSAGSGEFVITLRSTFAQTIYHARFSGNPGNTAYGGGAFFTGDGTSGVEVWDVSVVLATDSHLPYQWVNTASDYDADPAKFPAYRRLDGVDDSHASATGGGGTAGFFFSSAVSPQGGAGTARTLFSDAGTNTGYIVRLNTSNQLELAAGNGTTYTTVATSGTLAVGTTDIVQAWDDGTNLNVKIGNRDTESIARPVVSAGTAGYTMGQDNGASTGYFNGRIYSTIYRKDSGLTQEQREAVALYQRQKARMP